MHKPEERHSEWFHRFIYRAHKGEIPTGWQVHHLCHIRLCCNPAHLEAVPLRDHSALTSRERSSERRAIAKEWWQNYRCSGRQLAKEFHVSAATGHRWIREWAA